MKKKDIGRSPDGQKITVYKSNILVEAGNVGEGTTIYDTAGMAVDDEDLLTWIPPTTVQYKMMMLIFGEWARLNREVDEFPYVELTFQEYLDIVGLPYNGNASKICKLLHNCGEKSLLLPYKDEVMLVFPFDSFRINKKEKTIRARPSLFIIEHITKLDRRFTILPLEHIVGLTSVGAIRLYELCKEVANLKNNQRKFDNLPQLCRALFLEHPVKNWRIFLEKYISKYVEQINEKTDVVVRYETIKTGKNHQITGVIFSVSKKEAKALPDVSGKANFSFTLTDFTDRIKLNLMLAGFESAECEKIAQHTYSHILANKESADIDYYLEDCIAFISDLAQKCTKGNSKIKDRIAWIIAAIDRTY